MIKSFSIYSLLAFSLAAHATNIPKNLGSAINKNNPEYVAKYLAEGQSPAQSEAWGFGSPYFMLALDNVEKYKKDSSKHSDALRIMDLMVEADASKDARNEALRMAVITRSYRFLAPLVNAGADVNYTICQDLGFGLGKNSPWTILDFAAQQLSNSSITDQYYTAKAIKFLTSMGAVGGREIQNNCD
jgi:hypothetical protein